MATSTTFKLIEVANTDSARSVSIPSPALAGEGAEIVVKDTSGGASTHNITVTPDAGTIDGSASATIASDGGGMFLRSDGIQWLNIGGGGGLSGHAIEDEGVALTQRSTINFVGAGVAATDAGGKTVVTIGATTVPPLTFGPAEVMSYMNTYIAASVVNSAGSQSTACMFMATRALVCTGIRTFWKTSGTERTLTGALWACTSQTTGTLLANADASTAGTGLVNIAFASPVTILAGTIFMAACHNTNEWIGFTGSPNSSHPLIGSNTGSFGAASAAGVAGPGVVLIAHRAGAGTLTFPDAASNALASFFMGVEPILNNVTP